MFGNQQKRRNRKLEQTHFTELAEHMFEDVVGSSIEEGLQGWKVGAHLQDALQSAVTLGNSKKKRITHTTPTVLKGRGVSVSTTLDTCCCSYFVSQIFRAAGVHGKFQQPVQNAARGHGFGVLRGVAADLPD